MQKDRIKSYISTNITDKNGNFIAVNDQLLHRNSLCLFLKEAEKNKILVGYSDGKISKIDPKTTIRIDTEILKLNKVKDKLINDTNLYNEFKIVYYYLYYLNITCIKNVFYDLSGANDNSLYKIFSNLYERDICCITKQCYYLPSTKQYYYNKNTNSLLTFDETAKINYNSSDDFYYIILNSLKYEPKIRFFNKFYEAFYNYIKK